MAFTTRLGRGYWGAPLRRLADTFGLAGLVSAPVLVLVLRQLPEWHARPSIWLPRQIPKVGMPRSMTARITGTA